MPDLSGSRLHGEFFVRFMDDGDSPDLIFKYIAGKVPGKEYIRTATQNPQGFQTQLNNFP
jgi:hypothetical protein